MSNSPFKNTFAAMGAAVAGLSLAASSAMAQSTNVSVDWTAPDNSALFQIGQTVTPIGNANAFGGSTGTGLDLGLVLDSTGSMTRLETAGAITQSRSAFQADAAKALVDNVPGSTTSVSIVEFDTDANVVQSLTPVQGNRASLKSNIDSVDADGQTFLQSGIVTSQNDVNANATVGRSRQMVFVSDGDSSFSGDDPGAAAADAVDSGFDAVHSVLLPGGDQGTMEDIATQGSGIFNDATDISQLIGLFDGTGGSLVGLDRVEVETPDGTIIQNALTSGVGDFAALAYALEPGDNTWTATAFATDGSSASADLTLTAAVPVPGALPLMATGLGCIAYWRRRQTKRAA